jgi:hypothetical protein
MIVPVQNAPNSNAGRLDTLLVRLLEHGCRRFVEPALGLPIWDNGGAVLAQEAVGALGLQPVPVTGEEFARMLVQGFTSSHRQIRRAAPQCAAGCAGCSSQPGCLAGNVGGIR